MTRYVLLNANKNIQLVNMPLDKNLFNPVDSITDRICTVVSFETGSMVNEFEIGNTVRKAWENGYTESKLVINNKNYFLLFID